MSEKTFRSYLLLIIIGICVFVALINISPLLGVLGVFISIITPVFIGVGVAFVLNIPMTFLEKHLFKFLDNIKSKKGKNMIKVKRVLAITCTFLLILGAIAGIMTFIIPQLSSSMNTLFERLPDYIVSLNNLTDNILAFFKIPDNTWNQIVEQWNVLMDQLVTTIINLVPEIFDVTKTVTVGVFNSFLGIIISIYLLSDKEKLWALKNKLMLAYVPKDRADFIEDVSVTANRIFHGFIAGQLTEALILGTMVTIVLAILQIPYALLIGVLIGITSIIPVLGAFLGAVPSAFILLVVNPWYCLIFIVVIIVLQQIDNNFIYPRVVGNSVGLSGLWVLIGMFIGGSLFGFLGIILGIPTFAVFYSVFRKITNERLGNLAEE
ncbi:MAG: AI-2E family transporter [Eubacteriaceae bacterium]|nr:AI-2E family transporter [Eubacteriaceae bacterium]